MPPREQSLDAAVVSRQNLRDQILVVYPQLAEDEEALLGTLDGLDNFEDQMVAIMRQVAEREAHAKALGELITGMHERKQRLENGAKWLRAAVLHAMQEAAVPRIKAPDMSLSVSPGKPKLVIIDEAAVPESLCRVKREPDKKAIVDWLKESGTESTPAWCTWGNPVPFLWVHRK